MGKRLLQKAGLIGVPRPVAPPQAALPAGAGGPSGQGDAALADPSSGGAGAGLGLGAGLSGGSGMGSAAPGTSDAAGVARGAGAGASASAGSGVGPLGVGLATDALRPKTAPGTMLGFMTAQSAAIQEAEQLRARLVAFDGASPARRLDPALVQPSQWANRHEASFEGAEFAQLKTDIASAGGNVQAIKVRALVGGGRGVGPSNPLVMAPGAAPALPQAQYEIVYGHRRHRACLELGLPVLAVVEQVSEQQLFEEMERENRARKDLSAWEQGRMYARALDQGLYPSNRQLAAAVGRDLGDIGKALALARLPQAVVDAFASPLDLQYRWAKPLSDAQQKDPDGLIARALALKPRAAGLLPRQVFDVLVGTVAAGHTPDANLSAFVPTPSEWVIKRGRKAVAVLSLDAAGRTVLRFEQPLDEARRRALSRLVESFLQA